MQFGSLYHAIGWKQLIAQLERRVQSPTGDCLSTE